ncbi:MAG: guanylate kinase [Clostridia bacterium]|nr:guanylate kinase [Clostridia bacterium]
MSNKGLLFIVSGPAGSGKGTVVKELVDSHESIELSVSATTRTPRPGEINGVHYHFITRDEFENRIKNGEILEYTTYCDNYYGTPLKEVKQALAKGKDIILEIEVDGAMQVKKKMRGAVTIMLTPPDGKTLEMRLRSRGTEADDVIRWRLDRAKDELALMPKYDYSVVNEDGKAKECAELIYNIIKAEHAKTKHTKKIIKKFI